MPQMADGYVHHKLALRHTGSQCQYSHSQKLFHNNCHNHHDELQHSQRLSFGIVSNLVFLNEDVAHGDG